MNQPMKEGLLMAAALGLALAAAQGMANSYKSEDIATEVDSAYATSSSASVVRAMRMDTDERISLLRNP